MVFEIAPYRMICQSILRNQSLDLHLEMLPKSLVPRTLSQLRSQIRQKRKRASDMLTAFVALTLFCDDDPQWLIDAASRGRAEHAVAAPKLKKELPQLKNRLSFAKKGRVDPRLKRTEKVGNNFIYPTEKHKQDAIKELSERLDGYQRQIDGEPAIPSLPSIKFGVGDAGVLRNDQRMRVIQVLPDGQGALVEISTLVRSTNNNAVPLYTLKVWLSNSNANWVDGMDYDLTSPIVLEQPKTYETTNGTNTVVYARHWTDLEIARFKELAKKPDGAKIPLK
jgi:hypothetical protein